MRPVRDAFAARGFEVFWDQQVPSGADWDSWIRQQLPKSKCAVVFFSASSVASDNVRHEATIAKRQGKLISVLLEGLTAEQFPMGLYAQQAANLADWNSDFDHIEWRKLYREVETKLTPTWVQLQIHELEAELSAERARREITERRDKASQSQIAREVEAQQALRHERDEANDRLALLNLAVEKLRDERRGFESELQRFRASEVQQPAKRPADKSQVAKDSAPAASARPPYATVHKGTFFALVAEHRSIASVLVVVVATLAVGFYYIPRAWKMCVDRQPIRRHCVSSSRIDPC